MARDPSLPETPHSSACLRHAQECRELADRTPYQDIRKLCLTMSETWTMLADKPPPLPPED